jgi:uncharacterized membrane protein YGL010W
MATPFRPALSLLQQYADYHRDRRNIITHFIGVPMIVFAVGVLLSYAHLVIGGLELTAAWVVYALAALWYLTRGHLGIGVATSLAVGALIWLAHRVAPASMAQWLAWWVGFFSVGWAFQFVGHYYEGRKPAFVDDLVGLLVGPMFVVLELLAPLGFFKHLAGQVELHAGPTHIRDLAHPVAR